MTKHWGGSNLLHGQPTLAYLHSPCYSPRTFSELQLEWPPPPPQHHRYSSSAHVDYFRAAVAARHSFELNSPPPWAAYGSPWPADLRPAKAASAGSIIEQIMQLEPNANMTVSVQQNKGAPAKEVRNNGYEANEDSEDQDKKWVEDKCAKNGKKKNYQRYPKPPYSYLAMIAMVIQNSQEKKLTLSQILKEISTLFPFFTGNYKGWRDSVRHNLSSYDCFVKVLKDPGKPQGKGNFWAVDVSRVPLDLLKRQNTAVSRQEETVFAQDLAPYILHGQPSGQDQLQLEDSTPPSEPAPAIRLDSEDQYRPKLDSSFAIDSLLHSFKPGAGEKLGEHCKQGEQRLQGQGGWEPRPFFHESEPFPRPQSSMGYSSSESRSLRYSSRSTSGSSVSPASSSSSSEDSSWRSGLVAHKRPRPLPVGGEGSDSDSYEDCPTPLKSAKRTPAPWELPTSYTKYAPPNAVAPPSMRFPSNPFLQLGGLPFYNYRPSPAAAYVGPAYWSFLPRPGVPLQACHHRQPPALMDLDNLLQSVPPNKSVFDALVPEMPAPLPGQYTVQNSGGIGRYPPY
ncbi:forkhead box protein H1-like isoform X3 [Acipenser ruthenus]|nr:forkhead box protein H1-like isoform X3 [Acipenser ruthenus]XP_058874486.1 forkhead box protein H1-like isoform X3 [Acipenser ruthenus]XP_058874495.1 forkhead box protein H1-like isoform X3 [Acipenser ruthenus]XP_058874506.1 forkhead box protein H1-like isoform X3 [Acipenser ruthenus]